MIRSPASTAGIGLALLWCTTTAAAQDKPAPAVEIIVRPAEEPVPALKYRILPERNALVPGNAAIFYHRAIQLILQTRQRLQSAPEKGQPPAIDEREVSRWQVGPLSTIPRDQARRWLDEYRSALHEAELGARRQTCDWEFDLRQEGVEMLIPEIQEMRSLARLVDLRARVAVLDGKRDEAIYWIQIGYAMGRHVSRGPTFIQLMVGVSATSIMNKVLEDLIQAPGTPSLYWALADRPHPFIDLSPSLEGERLMLERELPQLRELDTVPWSLEQARVFSREMQDKLFKLSPLGRSAAPGPGGLQDWGLKLGLAAMVAQTYPEAKRALIAQGRPAAEVEAMPTIQVAALHTLQAYQRYRDDIFKWASLPYYQAYKGMDEAAASHRAEAQGNPLLRLFTLLLPSLRSVYVAQVRVDRQLDALQCIEAIRMYAAANGKFPARLEDITAAPVPIDVATGKPFGYRLEGDRAILSAPYPPGGPAVPQYAIRYDLTLAR